jgi:gamma-glutamyltranspeptidase / glutathione hydrolase
LADALRRIARDGAAEFYRGAIAATIVSDMVRHGGLLDAADLAAVQAPDETEPLVVRWGDAAVLTAGPPAGGAELALALGLLACLPQDGTEATWYVRLAQSTHAAFAERERRAGDGLEAAIAGDEELDELAARIERGVLEPALAVAEGGGETTHLCAADDEGNVVSLTQSIQSLFGAKVASERYGFLYNNYLTTCPRRRHRHRLRGGALARTNALPTLLVDARGAPRLALGAAGSRRIVSSTLDVLSAVHHRGMPLARAVAQPRVHPRLSRRTWVEADVPADALPALSRAGFEVERRAARSFGMGAVQAIEWHGPDMIGAADPRREGTARGR